MADYSKYSDKYLFEQPNKDEATQALFDATVGQETDRIIDKYQRRPNFLRGVAVRLAKQVLKTNDTDGTQNDLFV